MCFKMRMGMRTSMGVRYGGRPRDPLGHDAGRKVKLVKRHVPSGRMGLVLVAVVHPANAQDRDGASQVLCKQTR